MHRFVVAVVFCLASHAFAVDAYFASSAGGTWTNSDQWSDFAIPTFNTNVDFVGTAGGVVVLAQSNFQIPSVVFNSVNRTIVGDAAIGGYLAQTIDSEHVFQPSTLYGMQISLDPQIGAPVGNLTITKTGGGGLIVKGGNSAFSGSWIINAGTVQIDTDSALGTAGKSVTLNGGAIAQDSTIPRIALTHQLKLSSGTATLSGFGTYSGAISGNGNLRFGGAIESYLTATASHSGATQIVGSGTAGLYLTGGGQLTKTSGIDVSGQLFLANGIDRIGDAVPVSIHAGTLTFANSSSSAAANETFGGLSFGGGNLINLTSAGGATTLNVGALTRTDHGTINFTHGNNKLIISNGPSLLFGGGGAAGSPTIGILPFMIENTDFFSSQMDTVENGVVRPLASSEYLTSFTGSTAQTNVEPNSTVTLSSAASCNALALHYGSINGPGVLTVASGLIAGSGSTINAPLNFGSREGVLYEVLAATGPISGSGGLTIDEGGYVNTGTFNAANTFSGTTTINSGTVQLSADVRPNQPSTFGNDSSAVVLSQGYTAGALTAPTSITFARDLRVNTASLSSYHASALGGSMNVSGNIQLDGPLQLDGTFSIGGNIAGPSSLSTRYTGYLNLSGNNTFAGGLTLNGGTLVLGSNTALGTGTLTLRNSALINSASNLTLANGIFFDPASTITLSTNGNSSLSFSGPVDLGGKNVTFDIANAATRFTGIVANGSLTKTNNNALRVGQLAVANLAVNSGPMQLIASSPVSRVNTLSFAATGTLDLTNDDLIVDYAAASPAAAIRSQIIGKQLFSSSADSAHAVGYGESGTIGKFDGQYVDTTAVLVKYTFLGDVNLDGKVDISDLGILAQHWQQNGVWTDGDFDYSGKIDISDLSLLAQNWQAGVVKPSTLSFEQALSIIAVPEPAVGSLALTAVLLLRRRRVGCR